MTQQLTIESQKAPLDVFYDLREANPSPFGGYLDYGEYQIVCASPERFLKMKDHKVIPDQLREPEKEVRRRKKIRRCGKNCRTPGRIKVNCCDRRSGTK